MTTMILSLIELCGGHILRREREAYPQRIDVRAEGRGNYVMVEAKSFRNRPSCGRQGRNSRKPSNLFERVIERNVTGEPSTVIHIFGSRNLVDEKSLSMRAYGHRMGLEPRDENVATANTAKEKRGIVLRLRT
jgi:hypothetical protein